MIASRKSLPSDYTAPPPDDEALLAECEVKPLRGYELGTLHRTSRFTGVRLVHGPSGITVQVKRHPSRQENLDEALRRLRKRIRVRLEPPAERLPLGPTLGEQGSRLRDKHRRSRTKELRQPPEPPETT
jgi:hypothetical protein